MEEWVKRSWQQQAGKKAVVSFSYLDAKSNESGNACDSICIDMTGVTIR